MTDDQAVLEAPWLRAAVHQLTLVLDWVRFDRNEPGACIGCGNIAHLKTSKGCADTCLVRRALDNARQITNLER